MGWGNPVVLGSIVAGVVCLVLFVVRQGKIEDSLLQLGTLKTREFRVAAIIVTLINAACLVTNTLLPLLLQTSLGASAFETGMAMLPPRRWASSSALSPAWCSTSSVRVPSRSSAWPS